jgi:hypothetical protein
MSRRKSVNLTPESSIMNPEALCPTICRQRSVSRPNPYFSTVICAGSVPEVAVAKSMAERQASMAQMGLMMYTSSFEAIESDANGSEQEPKKSPG